MTPPDTCDRFLELTEERRVSCVSILPPHGDIELAEKESDCARSYLGILYF
jgi:hypothetical protein